jgi:hypothetical protein
MEYIVDIVFSTILLASVVYLLASLSANAKKNRKDNK